MFATILQDAICIFKLLYQTLRQESPVQQSYFNWSPVCKELKDENTVSSHIDRTSLVDQGFIILDKEHQKMIFAFGTQSVMLD